MLHLQVTHILITTNPASVLRQQSVRSGLRVPLKSAPGHTAALARAAAAMAHPETLKKILGAPTKAPR